MVSILARASSRRASSSNPLFHSKLNLFVPIVSGLCFSATTTPTVASSSSSSFWPRPPNQNDEIRTVTIVGGTHGNEYTGIWCIKALEQANNPPTAQFDTLAIQTLLANPAAYQANRRFLDTDLNREFHINKLNATPPPHTVEGQRAREINNILGPKDADHPATTDLAVDLHSTTTNMGLTLIVPQNDPVLAQAAAYIMHHCHDETPRILLHSLVERAHRPTLSSCARHDFTIEVGPVPQGVLRHDMVSKTQRALHYLLEYLHRRNQGQERQLLDELREMYPHGHVPCYQSIPATANAQLSSKIAWPSMDDNPNFPAYLVHKNVQDADFSILHTGDPLFVDLHGNVIPYNGAHGDPVQIMFVNEGGYYFASSGTGIGVAQARTLDLTSGAIIGDKDDNNNNNAGGSNYSATAQRTPQKQGEL